KACVLPENPASYRVVRTKSYLFNKAIGKRLRWARDYSSFGIREDENWRLVFLIFITPRFFLPPGKSVMWLRLDAARHVTGWFETIF
ncbi:hypothetical protein ACOIC7_24545, partial [Klebsiella pneumoniae]|uniref:hypothetical protein n=1 Tax=Klebsiella pneumoniae TaxID=573 RepID=UPI003B5A405E